MRTIPFFWGVCAGVMLGTASALLCMPKKPKRKTCVGRTMQNMGTAVDDVWERLQDTMGH